MVTWSDHAIILNMAPHGEKGSIVSVLTKNYGYHLGFTNHMRVQRKKSSPLQVGNEVNALWKSRIKEQLGTWQFEGQGMHANKLIAQPKSLLFLLTACQLLSCVLPERHQYGHLYCSLRAFLIMLSVNKGNLYEETAAYLSLEQIILKELGYGLNYKACAVTGKTENLIYISPKTGCAVTETIGHPYREKLFKLPRCFQERMENVTLNDLKEGLLVTGFFLNKHFSVLPRFRRWEEQRARLIQSILYEEVA